MLGANVWRYCGGNTSVVASDRYGGTKVTKRSSKWVNNSKIVESSWTAIFKARFSLSSSSDDETDNDFEKKTREVSSIGWKTIRATSEPV